MTPFLHGFLDILLSRLLCGDISADCEYLSSILLFELGLNSSQIALVKIDNCNTFGTSCQKSSGGAETDATCTSLLEELLLSSMAERAIELAVDEMLTVTMATCKRSVRLLKSRGLS